jgi:hypothetical protein
VVLLLAGCMSHSSVSSARLGLSFSRLHTAWIDAVLGPIERDPCDPKYEIVVHVGSDAYASEGLSGSAAHAGQRSLLLTCPAA